MGDMLSSQTAKEAVFLFAVVLLLVGFKFSVEGLIE